MRYSEWTAGIHPEDHRRFVLALGTASREIRSAIAITDADGEIVDLREHIGAAISWLITVQSSLAGAR